LHVQILREGWHFGSHALRRAGRGDDAQPPLLSHV
jgi:hypothetical protein